MELERNTSSVQPDPTAYPAQDPFVLVPPGDERSGDVRSINRCWAGRILRMGLALIIAACFTSGALAQGIIEGYVFEESTGDPLPGANVVIEGTTQGAATGPNGYYRIDDVAAGTQQLIVTSLGYARQNGEVSVSSGQTSRQDFYLPITALELEGVVVTGLRRGQVLSVNEKRQALSVVDVVSADEIGKLPDINVAESAQRIPGVTIRTDRGEGRFVSIRGTPPNRNNVTFNGQAMASSAGTRATALDLVPAEMVSTIEVNKAVTPDMDANALGGSVNINTLTAFDRPGQFVSASFSGLEHQLTTNFGGERFPFRSSLTAGSRFGANNEWGIVVSGTASRRDFNTAIASPSEWDDIDGIIAPDEYEREVEDNNRVRYGVNTNLDFRPTQETALFGRFHYSLRDEEFINTEVQYDGGDAIPTSETTGRYEGFDVELDIPTTEIDEALYAMTLGINQKLGDDLALEVEGTYTRGERDRLTFQPEWGFDQDFSLTYDLSGEFEELVFDDPAAVSNPANYLFDEMDIEFEDLIENTYQFNADLKWDFRLEEGAGFFKTGVKALIRDKDIDRNEDPWAAGDTPLPLTQFVMDSPDNLQGDAVVPITGSVDAFVDFWRANQDASDLFELDPVESAEEEVEVDAFVTEDVYAGYLMGNVELGAFTATGGVRIEATETTSDRYRFINDDSFDDAAIDRFKRDNSYVNVLPSLHLVYRLSNQLQLRGAFSTTIGRPDYEELAAFQDYEFEEIEEDIWEGGLEEGNPDLEPLRATNIDLSLEFYNRPGGLISIGGFYKRIVDPIYQFETTQEGILGSELLVEIDNIPDFDQRFFEEVNYQQLRNADDGYILGLELSFVQLFDFLPGPLGGFGLASNLAVMDSDVTVPDRDDDLPFFDQSDLVINVVPYYQIGPVEVRYALNYQSEFLDEVGSEAFEDFYGDERLTMDLSGRYEFANGRVQLNAYVRNLTNEAVIEYQGRSNRRSYHELTGRTFELGLSVQLP